MYDLAKRIVMHFNTTNTPGRKKGKNDYAEMALVYINYYMYLFNIGYRKEFQLETLMIALHQLIKRRTCEKSIADLDWL